MANGQSAPDSSLAQHLLVMTLGVAQTHVLAVAAQRVLVDRTDDVARTLLTNIRRALAPQGAGSSTSMESARPAKWRVRRKPFPFVSPRLNSLSWRSPRKVLGLPKEHPHDHHTWLPRPLVRRPLAA